MNCGEFSQNLSLYVDDALAPQMRAACDEHLRECPLCRAELAEMRALTIGLRKIEQPVVPFDLAASLRNSVAIELAAQTQIRVAKQPISAWREFWQKHLQPQIIPYTTGALATSLLFVMMFVSLRNSIETFRSMELDARRAREERAVLLAQQTDLPYEELPVLPAADYAVRRTQFAAESPSLNPSSAFVNLTASLTKGEAQNQAIMVVADVLGDGIANIADVIEPPREPQKLVELEKILHQNPAFVPATLDNRPNNVRVVLLIQQVEVKENAQPKPVRVKRF